MNGYSTVTKPSKEFRDWDIEPRTRTGGVDASDHSFYVWHGPADRWLALVRPRYGKLQKARKAVKPGMLDAPDYWPPPTARTRCLRSARND